MAHEIELNWIGNKKHDVTIDGHTIHLDNTIESGGENTGASPKKILLAALAGCTAMDVVSILSKMKEDLQELKIKVIAEEVVDETPKIYKSFHLVYMVKGKIDKAKVEKAVALSMEKYCSVAAMYRHFATVTFEIRYL